MSEEKKKETIETPFGELTKVGEGEFTGSNQMLWKLFEEAGVADAKTVVPMVMKGYSKVAGLVAEKINAPKVCETLKDVTTTVGTHPVRIKVTNSGERQVRNPSTGETLTVYGTTTAKVDWKLTATDRENGVFAKVAQDIEAAFKARRK